jgi:hypothetical protein
MNEINDFRSLLQSVVMHWQQSAKAYAGYMENGKKFHYAELLKLHNSAVKDLLTKNITLVPDHFKKEVADIIEHYTIWSAKWDELKVGLNPGPDDEFVFQNDHRFPRMAAQKLEVYYAEKAKIGK